MKFLFGLKSLSTGEISKFKHSIAGVIYVQHPELNAFRNIKLSWPVNNRWRNEVMALFPDNMEFVTKNEWMKKVKDYKEPPFQKGVIDGRDLS